jgi:hypothetical protein
LEGLIGEFLTRAIEEAFPNFCGAERHDHATLRGLCGKVKPTAGEFVHLT